MAAGEARAAWKRTANRCFVQEDAKRAPKLACCPPSSSKLQPDQCLGDAGNGLDQSSTLFMPFNWNPAENNLSPDTKWWLQLQPNYGRREFIFEQLKALETELDGRGYSDMKSTPPFDTAILASQDDHADPGIVSGPALKSHCKFSSASFKHHLELSAQDLKAVHTVQLHKHETIGSDQPKAKLSYMLMDSEQLHDIMFDQPRKGPSGNSVPWVSKKAGPWWQAVDRDELASLVAHSSLRHIENCDLPQPQSAHLGGIQSSHFEGYSDNEKLNSSSFDHKDQLTFSNDTGHLQQNLVPQMTTKAHVLSAESETSSRSSYNFSSSSGSNNVLAGSSCGCDCDIDANKVKLLEALCHSQTRASNAEKAAQRAHSEKEHIIKLFFMQATHLFAYKQLFRLLQLETICLQLRCKDNPMVQWDQLSALFPCLSASGKHVDDRNKKRKRSGIRVHDVGKFAFAVAVGLSLAGAGLFLGWTLGWLLPTF